MKRYTKKNGRADNEWAIFMSDGVAQIWSHENNIRFEGAPIDRLAAYEDTGLLPEEIYRVQMALNEIPFSRFREMIDLERKRMKVEQEG